MTPPLTPSTSNDAEPPLQVDSLSNPTPHPLDQQLQELELIQCSLFPGELFTFILSPEDAATWTSLLESRSSVGGTRSDGVATEPPCQARFQIRVSGARIWFEVELPSYKRTQAQVRVSVMGENISRGVQERWQAIVREKMLELGNSECVALHTACHSFSSHNDTSYHNSVVGGVHRPDSPSMNYCPFISFRCSTRK
ncbi:hypothetical protein PAXRUDRAFT_451946 [Paxillus rubicundulus Ve08.2h10]|uniref:Uncharacterized protein n=1 Tax=Paxillus rubicundulus Ve08.2h10 TaxID=930991 RepID=A0A0D0DQ70_9AGAM|nr:hypothetical protein PAXRUDRAFT_451946 [Paxillus rubicundulus Ve08.2h10]